MFSGSIPGGDAQHKERRDMSVSTLQPGRTIGGVPIAKVSQKTKAMNALFYGESGVGKTTLVGSADAVPEMRKVLMVDLEGGTESLRFTYPDIDVVHAPTWQAMQSVYNDLHRGGHGYNTVIVDSTTETQKFGMYNIMTDLVARKADESKYVDPDIPSVREWGKNIEQMRRFIRGMRDLPIHTLFTALAQSVKDEKTGATTIMPMLSGKLAGEIAAFLDVVGYYYVKEVPVEGEEDEIRRLLLCRKTARIVAKDRTGNLPMVTQEPTMQKLYTAMYTNKEKTDGA
jgi:AAA domain